MVVIRGCASSAAFWTSSWETSTILPSTPRSVITETPNTLMPQWFATITSGTVDMPTASAPRIWNILYSAGVSKVGPCVPIYTPCCTLMPFSFGYFQCFVDKLFRVGFAHVRKRGPYSIFFPCNGCSGKEVDMISDNH